MSTQGGEGEERQLLVGTRGASREVASGQQQLRTDISGTHLHPASTEHWGHNGSPVTESTAVSPHSQSTKAEVLLGAPFPALIPLDLFLDDFLKIIFNFYLT